MKNINPLFEAIKVVGLSKDLDKVMANLNKKGITKIDNSTLKKYKTNGLISNKTFRKIHPRNVGGVKDINGVNAVYTPTKQLVNF